MTESPRRGCGCWVAYLRRVGYLRGARYLRGTGYLRGARYRVGRPVALLCVVAVVWGATPAPVAAEGWSARKVQSIERSATGAALVAAQSKAARWMWPLAAVTVTNAYAAPATPYASGHRGIDLAAATGTPVTAPADAVVWFSGVVVDRPVLTLDHGGGVLSSYEPLSSPLTVGDTVRRGDPLGLVATGGHCASTCLHIGVRVDGEYVSPLLFFARVPRAVLLRAHRPSPR